MIIASVLTLLFALYTGNIIAFRYELDLDSENLYETCPEYPQMGADISNMVIDPLGNAIYNLTGNFTIIMDIGDDWKVTIDLYKWVRGEWKETYLSVHRNRACEFLTNPIDIAYQFVKSVENVHCPFRNGDVYNLTNTFDASINLPDPRLEGKYRARVFFGDTNNKNNFACNDIIGYAYRT